MKTILQFFIISVFAVSALFTQWQNDIRLTNNSGSSLTNLGKSIAVENNNLHVCWIDNRDGNFEVYYKRSTNAGANWSSDQRLTNSAAVSYATSICIEGANVYITFSDDRTGYFEIYFLKSTNRGLNWSSETRISTNDLYHSYESDIKANVYIYAAWLEERAGDLDIYFSRSANYGSTWSSPVKITPNLYAQKYPVLSASGSNVHVVFQDERAGGTTNTEIYYMRSTNNGLNWSGETNLSEHNGFSYNGYVYTTGTTVHAVWDDDWTGNREIFYRRSTNNGANWSGDAILTVNSGVSAGPSLTASGIYAHMVWSDERDGNREIYYKISTNNGSTWSSDLRLTNSSGYSGTASICHSGNALNVLWYDDRNGNNEIYFKRNPTGNPTGIGIISSEIPKKFSLSQNYPNPFNPVTKIRFSIPASSKLWEVSLIIYDMLGRAAATLVNEELKPGTYEVDWSAKGSESNFPSGVYFYRLDAGSFSETKRMILLK